MQEKVSIMCSWCGWENPSLGLRAALISDISDMLHYALGMDFPIHTSHQEHMKDTYTPSSRRQIYS